jgi:hypothetical protein
MPLRITHYRQTKLISRSKTHLHSTPLLPLLFMSNQSEAAVVPATFSEVLNKTAARALRSGTAGAAAMGANVAALMWMRTTINYQYRNGTTFPTALRTLYADGGIPRFYRGVLPALIQGPMSRFGDTAANTGVLTALDSFAETQDLPVFMKTGAASAVAAVFRIFLMPIDTVKTTMQVTGKFSSVVEKVKLVGPRGLYIGSLAAASASFVGHYPYVLVCFVALQIVLGVMCHVLRASTHSIRTALYIYIHTHTHTAGSLPTITCRRRFPSKTRKWPNWVALPLLVFAPRPFPTPCPTRSVLSRSTNNRMPMH